MPKINCCAECENLYTDSAKCYTDQFNKCSKAFHFLYGLILYHNHPCRGKCDHVIICNNFKRRK